MRFAGIDIGGERHAVAVVNDDGALLVRSMRTAPIPSNPTSISAFSPAHRSKGRRFPALGDACRVDVAAAKPGDNPPAMSIT